MRAMSHCAASRPRCESAGGRRRRRRGSSRIIRLIFNMRAAGMCAAAGRHITRDEESEAAARFLFPITKYHDDESPTWFEERARDGGAIK